VFGRLVSALLAVVAIAFLVIVALIVRERRDLLFWGGEAAAIANTVAETSIALAALEPDARAAEAARLRTDSITISRSGNLRPRPFDRAEFVAAVSSLRSRLKRDLGAGYEVTIRPARPGPPAVETIRVRTRPARDFERRRDGGPPGEQPVPGERPRIGERFEPNERLVPGERSVPEFGPRGGPGDAFARRIDAAPVGRELDVIVTLPDAAEVVFRTDVPRAGPPLPGRIFVELGLLTLALGAVLYLMARTITRPLTDLARAAEAVGRGERHPALRETGARELREATHAFNVMQERLHRYLDSRTHVLAAMSHDLRTPLTRLKLRVESLADDAQRERFGADLDEMIAMVTSALNLFKGLDDEPPQAVPIGPLLEELKREFAELGAEVEIAGAMGAKGALGAGGAADAARAADVGAAADAITRAKPKALKRCLTNLVSNAVKYGGRATVAVEDGSELVIRVVDEGPGIPEDSLERVFEPFVRLETSRNSATGGTGLGLGIARDIAQAHGGSLVLRNRSPRGLEAILTLPKRPSH
jgi:signal transduction histidine kinase